MTYFRNLHINGEYVTFDHLEPFQFSLMTELKPKGATVDVIFSNHCFSKRFDPALHIEQIVEVEDPHYRRVFDKERYELSKALADIIRSFPSGKVHRTPEKNFFQISFQDEKQDRYFVYFRLKKKTEGRADLELRVESAYIRNAEDAKRQRREGTIRFTVLVDKILKGEQIHFHQKR